MIVPVGRPVSMLLEPSNGSNTAAYSPENAELSVTAEHKHGSSSSSEATTFNLPEQHRAVFNILLAITYANL